MTDIPDDLSHATWPMSVAPEWLLREIDQAVFVADGAGTIVFWNRAAERLYGSTAPEALGQNVLDVAPFDQCSHAGEILERLVADGAWEGDVEVRRRDGSAFTALVSHTAILGPDGELTATVGLSRDVSEIRASQRAVATTAGQLRALVENSGDLLAITDADAVVQFLAGPVESLVGVPSDSLIGTSVFDLVRPPDVERARTMWSHQLATTEPTEPQDFWIQRADGGWICLNLKTTNQLDDPAVGGIVVTVRDVTDTRNRESARDVIAGANGALLLARNEHDLFSEICRVAVADETYQIAWAGIADSVQPLGFRVLAFGGPAEAYLDDVESAFAGKPHHGPVREVMETNTPYVVQDVEQMPPTGPFRQLLLDHGHRSFVLLPLRFGEGDVGVLSIYSARTNAFSDDALGVLKLLAGDIVFGIQALRTQAGHDIYRFRFEASLEAAVRAIATASELRDPYTAGHQRRVAQLAKAIATALGVDADLVTGIGLAASIHDIGKLVVPAEILSKSGPLSSTEFELVKGHPQAGYDIVDRIDFPWPVAEMILQHHERLDGSGYPNRLRGDEICLGGRIIAIADVVEAMSSHRPYRPGLGIDAALEAIAAKRGTFFCADAVDACLRVVRDDGFRFTEPS